MEVVFCEPEHRPEFILGVVDVVRFRIRRDYQSWNAKALSKLIDLGWSNVVVESSVVVPGDYYGR